MDRLLKILVLEDRKADFELCKRHLLREIPNIMFTRAANEAEFLDKIGRASYDIVIADYHLPDYNGLQALLYVKEHLPHLPFIFLTGLLNSEEKSAAAILEGANGYVLKDNISMLYQYVLKAISASDQNKKLADELNAKRMAQKISLQKAITLLRQADDFANRDQIIGLIEGIVSS